MRRLDTESEGTKHQQHASVQARAEILTESEGIKHRQHASVQARAEILRLADSQRATLAASFTDLLGDGGPSEETADDMIRATREWRDTASYTK